MLIQNHHVLALANIRSTHMVVMWNGRAVWLLVDHLVNEPAACWFISL